MKEVSGGVTAARGFLASGVRARIKRRGEDLALIFSDRTATAAGMTTTNRMAAAPVWLVRQTLRLGKAQAIVANSGNANCCTGPLGMTEAQRIRHEVASHLHLSDSAVLVASTGVIGRRLPTRRILSAIPTLVKTLSAHGSDAAAKAILTTDLTSKSVAYAFQAQGRRIHLGGIAKGSGMIDPAMATMLCFLTTDAAVQPAALRKIVRETVETSFNTITVDGQMSTNDTVLVLANGAAGNRPLQPGIPGWNAFVEALRLATQQLARAIVQDGEGASRFLTVQVQGAKTQAEALQAAKAIANAPLVKTMVRGADPNWGRLAATLGATQIPFDPARVQLSLGGVTVFRNGSPVVVDRKTLKTAFSGREVGLRVDLKRGRAQAQVYTCDLTEQYVRINAKYS